MRDRDDFGPDSNRNVTGRQFGGETAPTQTDAARMERERQLGRAPTPSGEPTKSDEQTDIDTSPSGNVKEEAPIGTVKDAVRTKGTQPAPKEDAAEESKAKQKRELLGSVPNESEADKKKREEEKKEAPITSVAQLRDWHVRHGSSPTQEEIEKVRELEREIAKEGAKHVRKSSAERGK